MICQECPNLDFCLEKADFDSPEFDALMKVCEYAKEGDN